MSENTGNKLGKWHERVMRSRGPVSLHRAGWEGPAGSWLEDAHALLALSWCMGWARGRWPGPVLLVLLRASRG